MDFTETLILIQCNDLPLSVNSYLTSLDFIAEILNATKDHTKWLYLDLAFPLYYEKTKKFGGIVRFWIDWKNPLALNEPPWYSG